MKISYTTRNGRISFEFEATKPQEIWTQLCELQELFEETCGKCNSDDIKYVIRKAKNEKGKEFLYYELRCRKCWAKLSYGIFEDASGLFPKRKREDGKIKGTNGWCIFNKDTQKEE